MNEKQKAYLTISPNKITWYPKGEKYSLCSIKNVIYNPPRTIVVWADDTKTIVKCNESDKYSKETGLLMCIAKRAFGNTGRFNDILEEWCWSKEEKSEVDNKEYSDGKTIFDNPEIVKKIKEKLKGLGAFELLTLYILINRWELPAVFINILNPPQYIIDNFNTFPNEVKARTLAPLLDFIKSALGEIFARECFDFSKTSPTLEDYLNENKNLG